MNTACAMTPPPCQCEEVSFPRLLDAYAINCFQGCYELLTFFLSQESFLGLAKKTLAWFLAASPTSLSVSVKATYEGVVRLPWSTRARGREGARA
jgi:hypothetical protein